MKYKLLILLLPLLSIPFITQGADFVGLVGIPGIENPTEGGLGGYINALYRLSISIAALLAVIKIVAAGAKYMLTDIVPAKEDAKKDIQGALIGLLIVIGAIIILNTVNTDLTNLNLTVATTTIQQGEDISIAIAEVQKSKVDRMCALADASKGESCITEVCESGECTKWCTEQNGVYFKGVDYGWVTDTLDYFDKCVYINKPDPGNLVEIEETGDPEIDKIACETREDHIYEQSSGGLFYCIYQGNTNLSPEEEAVHRSVLCEPGYTCEIKLCEAGQGWFRSYRCNSWCSTESGSLMEYSEEEDVCFSNIR